jgi:hypothetical protein
MIYLDSMKVDDRRLPRPIGPIGGERMWKGGSGVASSGGGHFTDEPPPPPPQMSNWLGMYGSSNQQPQGGFPPQQQQQRGIGDRSGGNVMGRRYMDDVDANRILEMQHVRFIFNE